MRRNFPCEQTLATKSFHITTLHIHRSVQHVLLLRSRVEKKRSQEHSLTQLHVSCQQWYEIAGSTGRSGHNGYGFVYRVGIKIWGPTGSSLVASMDTLMTHLLYLFHDYCVEAWIENNEPVVATQIFFYFHPENWGRGTQLDEHIFQMG